MCGFLAGCVPNDAILDSPLVSQHVVSCWLRTQGQGIRKPDAVMITKGARLTFS